MVYGPPMHHQRESLAAAPARTSDGRNLASPGFPGLRIAISPPGVSELCHYGQEMLSYGAARMIRGAVRPKGSGDGKAERLDFRVRNPVHRKSEHRVSKAPQRGHPPFIKIIAFSGLSRLG